MAMQAAAASEASATETASLLCRITQIASAEHVIHRATATIDGVGVRRSPVIEFANRCTTHSTACSTAAVTVAGANATAGRISTASSVRMANGNRIVSRGTTKRFTGSATAVMRWK